MPRSFRRSSTARSRTWAGALVSATALSTTQAILTSFSLSTDFEETLLRLRGELLAVAVPNAAADEVVLGLGLIVVQQAAAAAGGTSVPGPLNDQNANWQWHMTVPLFDSISSSGSVASIGLNARIHVDSKAMRKIAADQEIVLVGELNSSSMASVEVIGGIRVLSQITGL